jgi:arabinose-5-phosphate isomerase
MGDQVEQEIRRSLEVQREGLSRLIDRVDGSSAQAAAVLHDRKGRVFAMGAGKTGIVAQKIAATFSSVGIPTYFLHPVEAMHGDLGLVRDDDIVLAVSNSGETPEVLRVLPHLVDIGVTIIALTGATDSSLAQFSDVVVDVGVEEEADALNLAPTASTTAAMAMGDALASAVMRLSGFSAEAYGRNHPAGSIGALLLARVSDLMVPEDRCPVVNDSVPLQDAIYVLSSMRLGAVFVTAASGVLAGIVTDGDLRRVLERDGGDLSAPVNRVMTSNPKSIHADARAEDAMRIMESHSITVLPVVDDSGKPISAVHLHDLVKAGLGIRSQQKDSNQ